MLGFQFLRRTPVGGDPPQRKLPVTKEALYKQFLAIRMPVRTHRADVAFGKLQHFHASAIDMRQPELVARQAIAVVRDLLAIRRELGVT
jgi:hypothetical protein